jgi:biotin carboxylase
MKKVLLLCASHNDLGLIKALRKLGFYIISTGNISGLMGEKYADKYIQADYSDKELILRIAKEEKINFICACCNDFGVYTAAYVAEILNLPGYDSYKTTLILHNKDKFKQFAFNHDIITPIAESFADVCKAKQRIKSISYPIIVKPTDCSAGNGIQRADNITEALIAVDSAFEKSRVCRIVIEPFITGTQHGFCTFLVNRKVVVVASNNEYSFLNPYRVEIDTFPADNYDEVKDVLIAHIEKMADILSLKDGIFHLQYIMNDGKPYIIEVMRRTIGNMYWVPAGLLNGFDWNYWEARARCGMSCDNFPKNTKQEGFYAYKSLLAKQNGIIKTIDIPKKYEKYLIDVCVLKEPGYKIIHHKSDLIGLLFFMFSSDKEMKETLIENYDDNLVEIESE